MIFKRQRREMKGRIGGKAKKDKAYRQGRMKTLSLFKDDIMVYVENLMGTTTIKICN